MMSARTQRKALQIVEIQHMSGEYFVYDAPQDIVEDRIWKHISQQLFSFTNDCGRGQDVRALQQENLHLTVFVLQVQLVCNLSRQERFANSRRAKQERPFWRTERAIRRKEVGVQERW